MELHKLWFDAKLVEDVSLVGKNLDNRRIDLAVVAIERKLFDKAR